MAILRLLFALLRWFRWPNVRKVLGYILMVVSGGVLLKGIQMWRRARGA